MEKIFQTKLMYIHLWPSLLDSKLMLLNTINQKPKISCFIWFQRLIQKFIVYLSHVAGFFPREIQFLIFFIWYFGTYPVCFGITVLIKMVFRWGGLVLLMKQNNLMNSYRGYRPWYPYRPLLPINLSVSCSIYDNRARKESRTVSTVPPEKIEPVPENNRARYLIVLGNRESELRVRLAEIVLVSFRARLKAIQARQSEVD